MSDDNTIKILKAVKAGCQSIPKINAHTRIPRIIIRRLLIKVENKGLIMRKCFKYGKEYRLTQIGKNALKQHKEGQLGIARMKILLTDPLFKEWWKSR